MDNYNFIQQGWQCPLCKRVYSPSTSCCFVYGGEGITKTSTDLYADIFKPCCREGSDEGGPT